MDNANPSSIEKVVRHNGGPAALSRLLGGSPAYQEIQRWVKRGWASPMHIFRLEPFMPPGIGIRDLNDDRIATESAKEGA